MTDINFTSRPYGRGLVYGQSKTSNVLFAVDAARRWVSDGLTANAVQPGPVAATTLNRHQGPDALAAVQASAAARLRLSMKTLPWMSDPVFVINPSVFRIAVAGCGSSRPRPLIVPCHGSAKGHAQRRS